MGKELKIYLAGKMSGLSLEEMNNWRIDIKDKLLIISQIADYQLQIINPVNYYNFEEKRYQSEAEVEDYDLAHVVSSDLIIVNLEGLNSSDGTKLEIHDAKYHYKIPVLAFGNKDLYNDLHPWVKRNITRVEKNVDDIIGYIHEFYMI